jgi:predicted acylesterase/phospholipase RssA
LLAFDNHALSVDDSPIIHKFEFNNDPLRRFQIWEAARASCAAPGYFKPFEKYGVKNSYYDGGLYNNNPAHIAVQESMLVPLVV